LGDFALELLDQETGEVVAGCGFRIQPYEGLDYMFITNTPQGRRLRSKNPDGISREAHGRLMCNTSFRDELLSVLSDLAGGLQLRGMIATSASNHSKTINHEISYEFGCRVIDELLLQNGFEYNVDGNLVKIFRKV
jgi:hypothetical protein